MRSFALFLLLASGVLAQSFFDNSVIDDLQKVVDKPTKEQLKTLRNNRYISRAQKKEEFEKILHSQPQSVQDAFSQLQSKRQLREQKKEASLQQRMQWMPPSVAAAVKQAEEAKNDLSLSDMDYWNKRRQIWSQVNGRWY
uniref:DUF3106 domain-containing protein n=1 Tax=Steinernema glaseri TaxID=37863 RepID=A0A1I8ANJ4_9BILA